MGLKLSYIIQNRGHHAIFFQRFVDWFLQLCHSPPRWIKKFAPVFVLHSGIFAIATSTQWRIFFSFEWIFSWFFGKIGSFFRKWLFSDQSNVARIFGVRNLRDFCCTLQCNPTHTALNRSDHHVTCIANRFLRWAYLPFEGLLKLIEICSLIFVLYLRPLLDAPRFFANFVSLGGSRLYRTKTIKLCLPHASW